MYDKVNLFFFCTSAHSVVENEISVMSVLQLS